MNMKKAFHVNEDASENGVWFPYEDAEFLVARTKSQKYRNEIERVSRRYRRQIEMGTLSRTKSEEIVSRAMANTILNGWRGRVALDDDGTDLPYSRENAFRLLNEFPDFRELVSNWAADLEAFQSEEKEREMGNLDSSSNGTSNTTEIKSQLDTTNT